MQIQPGTAQEIPIFAKIIILGLSIIAVVLTAAWGKLSDIVKSKRNNKRVSSREREEEK